MVVRASLSSALEGASWVLSWGVWVFFSVVALPAASALEGLSMRGAQVVVALPAASALEGLSMRGAQVVVALPGVVVGSPCRPSRYRTQERRGPFEENGEGFGVSSGVGKQSMCLDRGYRLSGPKPLQFNEESGPYYLGPKPLAKFYTC